MKIVYNNKRKNIFVRLIIIILILSFSLACRLNCRNADYVSAFTVIGDGLCGDVGMREALQDAYIYSFGEYSGDEKFKG